MTDMLSVVARAIDETSVDGFRLRDLPAEKAVVHALIKKAAKAAIEAHEKALEEQGLVIVPREPTDVTVGAVQVAIGGKLSWGLIETILRAGIDKALEGKDDNSQ